MHESDANQDIVDLAVLKDMFGDDDKQVRNIFMEFIETAEEIYFSIITGVNNGEMEIVCAEAHKLKSSSWTIGAMKFGNTCLAMERAGEENYVTEITNLFPKFLVQYDEMMNFLKSY